MIHSLLIGADDIKKLREGQVYKTGIVVICDGCKNTLVEPIAIASDETLVEVENFDAAATMSEEQMAARLSDKGYIVMKIDARIAYSEMSRKVAEQVASEHDRKADVHAKHNAYLPGLHVDDKHHPKKKKTRKKRKYRKQKLNASAIVKRNFAKKKNLTGKRKKRRNPNSLSSLTDKPKRKYVKSGKFAKRHATVDRKNGIEARSENETPERKNSDGFHCTVLNCPRSLPDSQPFATLAGRKHHETVAHGEVTE